MSDIDKILQPVRETLDKGNTLYYESATRALECSLENIKIDNVKDFLDIYLIRIIGIVTDQEPGKCDQFTEHI